MPAVRRIPSTHAHGDTRKALASSSRQALHHDFVVITAALSTNSASFLQPRQVANAPIIRLPEAFATSQGDRVGEAGFSLVQLRLAADVDGRRFHGRGFTSRVHTVCSGTGLHAT